MQERKYTSPHTFITDSDFSWDKLYHRYVLNSMISLEISHLKTKPPVCALSYLTNGPLLNGTWRKTIFFFGENRFYLCNSCSRGQWEPARCGEKGRLAKSPKRSRWHGNLRKFKPFPVLGHCSSYGTFLALPSTPVFGALGNSSFNSQLVFCAIRFSGNLSICFRRVRVSLSVFNVRSLASHSPPYHGRWEMVKAKWQK